eukprot:jgi/Bigna1/141967/aug1.66_g16675
MWASAKPHPESGDPQGILRYLWSGENGTALPISVGDPTIPPIILAPGATLSPGVFTFQLKVTDPLEMTETRVTVSLTVVATPNIASISCEPRMGAAFSTPFALAATVVGSFESPLSFRFASINVNGTSTVTTGGGTETEQLLSSYGTSNQLNTSLPAGMYRMKVDVLDGLGGVSTLATSYLVDSRPYTPASSSSGQWACAKLNATLIKITSLLGVNATICTAESDLAEMVGKFYRNNV